MSEQQPPAKRREMPAPLAVFVTVWMVEAVLEQLAVSWWLRREARRGERELAAMLAEQSEPHGG